MPPACDLRPARMQRAGVRVIAREYHLGDGGGIGMVFRRRQQRDALVHFGEGRGKEADRHRWAGGGRRPCRQHDPVNVVRGGHERQGHNKVPLVRLRSARRGRPLWELHLVHDMGREETLQRMDGRQGVQGSARWHVPLCVRVDHGRIGHGPEESI